MFGFAMKRKIVLLLTLLSLLSFTFADSKSVVVSLSVGDIDEFGFTSDQINENTPITKDNSYPNTEEPPLSLAVLDDSISGLDGDKKIYASARTNSPSQITFTLSFTALSNGSGYFIPLTINNIVAEDDSSKTINLAESEASAAKKLRAISTELNISADYSAYQSAPNDKFTSILTLTYSAT